MPVETLDLWLRTWRGQPDLRAGVRQAWGSVYKHMQELPAAQRVRHVGGPPHGTVLHLMEAG
eukprot:8434709-Pyramimonas_sp.AAC.1